MQLKERVSFRCRQRYGYLYTCYYWGEKWLGRIRLPQSKLILCYCRSTKTCHTNYTVLRTQSKLYFVLLSHKLEALEWTTSTPNLEWTTSTPNWTLWVRERERERERDSDIVKGLQMKTTVGVVLCFPTQGGSNQILLQILQILQTLNQD